MLLISSIFQIVITMGYKIFLDDERDPPDDGWLVVRNVQDACAAVEQRGFPLHVSFDNDLGSTGPEGRDFAPETRGGSRMHEPSASHSRPLYGSYSGTFRPSRYHRRSTRLSLTTQPPSPQRQGLEGLRSERDKELGGRRMAEVGRPEYGPRQCGRSPTEVGQP